MPVSRIVRSFSEAAPHYDDAASVQKRVANTLVSMAAHTPPNAILDIGSGTGFIAEAASLRWPKASLAALDIAPGMLKQAQSKIPHLRTVVGDMQDQSFGPEFDLIFSSMALHWLADPAAVLEKWLNWLTPHGRIFVALPVAGSFEEWENLCSENDVPSGLWPLPDARFSDSPGIKGTLEDIVIFYPTAHEFLRVLKRTGASTPRPGHRPVSWVAMERLLRNAPQPFPVTYRIAYIEKSFPSI